MSSIQSLVYVHFIFVSHVSNILEIIPCLDVPDTNMKVGMRSRCEPSLCWSWIFGSLDKGRRQGRGVSNPTDRSVRQEVEAVSPGVTCPFRPVKHRHREGSLTPLLAHYVIFFMGNICLGTLHRQSDPVGSNQ